MRGFPYCAKESSLSGLVKLVFLSRQSLCKLLLELDQLQARSWGLRLRVERLDCDALSTHEPWLFEEVQITRLSCMKRSACSESRKAVKAAAANCLRRRSGSRSGVQSVKPRAATNWPLVNTTWMATNETYVSQGHILGFSIRPCNLPMTLEQVQWTFASRAPASQQVPTPAASSVHVDVQVILAWGYVCSCSPC